MEAARTSAPTPASVTEEGKTAPAVASQDVHLRRCLVTGEMLPKTELLRFVVGPDQTLYPDLAQNLPGLGLWVSVSHEAVTTAAKKNLFAKAAKTAVKVGPDLAGQVAQLMRKRCLDFMGLSKRSGTAILGQTQVEAELKAGKLVLLLLADDAGTDLRAYRATNHLQISAIFTRHELGAALGHEQLVYLGFKAHALTKKLQNELKQLEKITEQHHIDTQKNG
jgi:predicted RNA-binding protein YlxR (DUF448 family)